jgi:putative intracellular protease/amidase
LGHEADRLSGQILTVCCQHGIMLSMSTTKNTAHIALYDTLADWEVGHLLVELRTGRFTGRPWDVVSVGESPNPVTTMGGLRIVPDMVLTDLDPGDSGLLVLPGADVWEEGGDAFTAAAARFLEAGVAVAAICGATVGLARAGLLDRRRHTSAAPEALAYTGYAGAQLYVHERAVVDDGLITAGPQSPVQFARTTLGHLGLADETTLDAYERVFHDGDASAYPVLMQASLTG